MVRIDQAGKGLRIALLAHMPIGSPGKLPPRRLATGLGHAREPEINAIGQNRSGGEAADFWAAPGCADARIDLPDPSIDRPR